MRVALGSSKHRLCWRRAGCMAALGIVAALAGCGREAESQSARVDGAVLAAARLPDSQPVVQAIAEPTRPGEVPFELMGTTLTAARSFAILRKSGHRLFTVTAGDKIDGYTIVSIDAGKVVLTAPDNTEQRLMAAIPSAPVAVNQRPAATPPPSQLITTGVNTDQSAPAAGTTVSTAYDPNNGHQMGH